MKQKHFDDGVALMQRFCAQNKVAPPTVATHAKADWHFGVCAYYRPVQIEICLADCANIGTAGMSWSYPGYTVDRTPYGVVQHELGHHVDVAHSTRFNRYRGDFSVRLRQEASEAPISNYCPDDGEWFAEMFRVFVTNPDLLRILRPATYELIRRKFTPVIEASWDVVLTSAPDRTKGACSKKVIEATRRPRLSPVLQPAQGSLLDA